MRTKSEDVVVKITELWSQNWDYLMEVLGEQIAQQLDEAYREIKNKEKTFNEHENL